MQIVAILSLAELINKGTIKIKKTKWLIITIFKERCIPKLEMFKMQFKYQRASF